MISENKIFFHLGNGERPVTADIYLTDRCNNACSYCNYTRYEKRHGDIMTIADFKKYIDKLLFLGVQGVILTGGGEPTVNPYFDKIIGYLEEISVPYGVNTNFNNYHDCHPFFLKVSLDGYNKESYYTRRGVDAYDRTIENIKKFTKEKGNTKVGLQMLTLSEKDVGPFYEAHQNIDFDYMVFRPIESRNGSYYFDDKNAKEAESIIKAVDNLQKKDSRVSLNYKFRMLHESKYADCPAHWSQLCVNPRGEVLYCCHKPNEIIGHILDDDILEKHRAADFRAESCDAPCRLSGPNDAMRKICHIKDRMFL